MIWSNLICFYLSFISLCFCQEHTDDKSMQTYLEDHIQHITNKLTNMLESNVKNKDLQINIKFNAPTNASLLSNCTDANTFFMFNKMYMLIYNHLYYINCTNNTIKLNQYMQIREIQETISFLKTTEFKTFGFIFTAFPNGYSYLYGYFNSTQKWSLIQTISNSNRATDAKFFVNKNHLYLIIINTAEQSLAHSIIYKWSGAHFDAVDKILTRHASIVLSFSSHESEIILLEQSFSHQQQHNLDLFEFCNDNIRKIQQLIVETPNHIIPYLYQDKQYLIILQETNNSTVYQWDGFEELVSLIKFSNYSNIEKVLLFNTEELLILFLIQEDHLLTFSFLPNNLHLISTFKLANYNKILDMEVISHNDTKVLLIFLLTNSHTLNYITVPFTTYVTEVESKTSETDILIQCLSDLEENLNTKNYHLSSVTESSTNIIHGNKPLQYGGRMSAASAHAESANLKLQSIEFRQDVIQVKSLLNNLTNRVNALNPKLNALHKEGAVNHGKLIINGSLFVDQLWSKNLHIKYLNSWQWAPNKWLSYTKPQTVTGPVSFKNLLVKSLHVSKHTALQDIFQSNKDPVTTYEINSLTANNIYATKVNGIPFKYVYLRSKPTAIHGLKKFNNLNINRLQTRILNNKNASTVLKVFSDFNSKGVKFASNMYIKNLNIKEINGINWMKFKQSVFRINVTTQITGSLTIPEITANKIFINKIANIHANSLITTKTEQTITSILQIPSIYVENVICNKINDVSTDDMATLQNNFIKGPVTIENMHVLKNLNLTGSVNKPSMEIQENHIIGSNETDLLQVYNKKVKIIGSLTLSNVAVSKKAKVLVNNREFESTLENYFWLKNKNQVVSVFFEAENGISIPHLSTITLNNISISNYMVNNLEDKLPANLIFEKVTVQKNVLIDHTKKHIPDLQKLEKESVKLTGRYNITGCKIIQGRISAGNLITKYLDEIKVSDAVTSADEILGTNIFENVIINNNVISNNIDVNVLNDVPLRVLLKTALFIDKPEDIEMLKFYNIEADNIYTSSMNQKNFVDYTQYLNNIYDVTALNNVLVNGNVKINHVKQLNFINNYEMNNIQSNVTRRDGSVIFPTNVKFLKNVYAKNVEVAYINTIDFGLLIQRLLYKEWNQNISAPYIFDKITTPNVLTPQINNIVTKFLINTKDPNLQSLLVWGGLQLVTPKFLKNVDAEVLTCNIQQAISKLKSPPTCYWNVIHIAKNISLWDDYCDLNDILKNSVLIKQKNIIKSMVTFEHLITSDSVYIQKLINGINLNEIMEDVLLKTMNDQVITGRKNFKRMLMSNGFVKGNSQIPIINTLDIAVLNRSIVYKNNMYDGTITGSKVFFSGLQAHRLISNTICDLHPDKLVSLTNLKKIPDAYFQTLEIDNNFNIAYVNDLNMFYYLSEQLLLNSPDVQTASGTYYFDNVLLVDNSNITAINDLIIEDVVLNSNTQVILGSKIFTQDVLVNGNIAVTSLNGQDLQETFKQAVLIGEANTLRNNIKFNNRTVIVSNVQASNINGISINTLLDYIQTKTPIVQTKVVHNIIQQIEGIISNSYKISKHMSNKYLYLERSNELQISIPNAISAYAFQFKDSVMLHVVRQEPGSVCGLPDTCSCPLQDTLQITAEFSINTVAEIGIQRVFSYEDGKNSIHLFTNSISTSEACRANDTMLDETTSLMWMSYSQNKSSEKYSYLRHLRGYISGVEYFHINAFMYMVVTIYYEPKNNTHDVDCLIYKFSEEQMSIRLIQTIKTKGAWTLYLLQTAQGINLIIGSISDSEELNINYGAQIYRFNDTAEQFMLLRHIASAGCTSAVGVVLGPDSLFILAQKDAPLQVLKYHPKYDNYYFYQNIFLDSLVTGLSVFYTGHFGISDPLLCIVTQSSNFYVYSYQYIQGWFVVSKGEIEGLHTLIPFVLKHKHYLFALSTNYTTLLTVVKHGSN